MKNYLSLAILCLCCAACGPEEDPRITTYQGLYSLSFEHSTFQACGGSAAWWVEFWTDDPDDIFRAAGIENNPDWEARTFVQNRLLRVRGVVNMSANHSSSEETNDGRSGYGHMSKYAGEIRIYEVLEAREATESDIAACQNP